MKIGELAKRSGLSAHTIRYYERIGLIPYAARDRSGQRDYDAAILVWIEFLQRMKTTGMPIRDMLRYAALRLLPVCRVECAVIPAKTMLSEGSGCRNRGLYCRDR
jgi:DNA-binding transcriptional MerR regulator